MNYDQQGHGPDHVHVIDRRKRRPVERFQVWLNYVASALLAVPMIIEPIKGHLPEHWYGVISSLVAVLNAAIGTYRFHRSNHRRYPVDA